MGDRHECKRLREDGFCSCWVWFVHPCSLGKVRGGCFWTQKLLDAERTNTSAHKSVIPSVFMCVLHGHMNHILHYYKV